MTLSTGANRNYFLANPLVTIPLLIKIKRERNIFAKSENSVNNSGEIWFLACGRAGAGDHVEEAPQTWEPRRAFERWGRSSVRSPINVARLARETVGVEQQQVTAVLPVGGRPCTCGLRVVVPRRAEAGSRFESAGRVVRCPASRHRARRSTIFIRFSGRSTVGSREGFVRSKTSVVFAFFDFAVPVSVAKCSRVTSPELGSPRTRVSSLIRYKSRARSRVSSIFDVTKPRWCLGKRYSRDVCIFACVVSRLRNFVAPFRFVDRNSSISGRYFAFVLLFAYRRFTVTV